MISNIFSLNILSKNKLKYVFFKILANINKNYLVSYFLANLNSNIFRLKKKKKLRQIQVFGTIFAHTNTNILYTLICSLLRKTMMELIVKNIYNYMKKKKSSWQKKIN